MGVWTAGFKGDVVCKRLNGFQVIFERDFRFVQFLPYLLIVQL